MLIAPLLFKSGKADVMLDIVEAVVVVILLSPPGKYPKLYTTSAMLSYGEDSSS